MLNARSEDYVPSRDNIEEMICDYIAPVDPQPVWDGTISGPSQIRVGQTRSYTADFDVEAWSLGSDLPGLHLVSNENAAELSVDLCDDLIGEIVTIVAVGDIGVTQLDVEVIA